MRDYRGDLITVGNCLSLRMPLIAIFSVLVFCLFCTTSYAETIWKPYVGLLAIQDDNIRFTDDDDDSGLDNDDYIYVVEPGVALDYNTERTKIDAEGNALVRRYQENDDFDDTIYRLDLDGGTKITERFNLRGGYEFIKDTTLDSELEETGRVFIREDRLSHDVRLAPSFNFTERLTIGISGRYRDVAYESDTNADYSSWSIGMPVRWRLATQVDSIYFFPGYSFRDTDNTRNSNNTGTRSNSSESYSFRVGWTHETTERLNFDISAGTRYTDHERIDTEDGTGIRTVETDENWSFLGAVKLKYELQTGNIVLDLRHDLRNTADGNQVNVTRVITRLAWRFSDRFGMGLEGRYYYTQTEGEVDDDSTEFIQFKPELIYNLTEEHIIFIAYEYSQEQQNDVENDPRAERNRLWAGVRLNFPLN